MDDETKRAMREAGERGEKRQDEGRREKEALREGTARTAKDAIASVIGRNK